jgi:hypothetical protein
MRILYQYDMSGYLIKHIGYDGKNNEIFFSECTYNPNDLLLKIIIKNVSGEDNNITTYEYDSKGRLIKSNLFFMDGELLGYSLYSMENNKLMAINNYDAKDYLRETIYYIRDDSGRIINTVNERKENIEYREYNERNLVEKIIFNDGRQRVFLWEKGKTKGNPDLYFMY